MCAYVMRKIHHRRQSTPAHTHTYRDDEIDPLMVVSGVCVVFANAYTPILAVLDHKIIS